MNEAIPATPDCLLEIDENLYSLTALIEAQAALKAADIDESSVTRNAIEATSISFSETMGRNIIAAGDERFLPEVLGRAIGSMQSPIFERISRQLSEQCSTGLQEQQEAINEMVDATIEQVVTSKVANVQSTLDSFSKGLKARTSLQRLVAGEASLPKSKAFYQRAVKERITSYIAAINSLVPADFQ